MARRAKLILSAVLTAAVGSLALFFADEHATAQQDESAPAYAVPPNPAAGKPPEQPIPYSHALHAGAFGLTCDTCHLGASLAQAVPQASLGGKHITLPPTDICMGCHQTIATDRAPIEKLTEYHRWKTPVPWVRVYALLDGVTWSHKPHLEAGVACETCHGDVAALDVMHQATAVTAMATCINCHEAANASTACATCHAWPAPDDFARWTD